MMEDDVTIEDDVTMEDQFQEILQQKSELKQHWTFDQILNGEWMIYLVLLSVVIGILFYWKKTRERNVLSSRTNSSNLINRYDEIERVRERQQKAYEEQSLRYNEEQKLKIELRKAKKEEEKEKEKNEQVKYRSNDFNPLTGQSSKDSCSWRPASSRRKAMGG